MLAIHLSNLRFFCHHGLYEEEKMVAGEFMVNVDVELKEPGLVVRSLNQSVDYAKVYQIVKQRMAQPTPLLETVAMELANSILSTSILTKKVFISITKVVPPIVNFEGRVTVSYSKEK